jgi:hypothetical protein
MPSEGIPAKEPSPNYERLFASYEGLYDTLVAWSHYKTTAEAPLSVEDVSNLVMFDREALANVRRFLEGIEDKEIAFSYSYDIAWAVAEQLAGRIQRPR